MSKFLTLYLKKIEASIGAVYKGMADELGVSKSAVYGKLNRLEPTVSQALVRYSAREMTTIIEQVGGQLPALLTNLPLADASSILVAQLYRKRWRVETLFQVATETFHCEIKTLGYPRAALFSFSMALVAYNLVSTLKGVLASVHGSDCLEKLFYYYLAEELDATYQGMMIALPLSDWQDLATMSLPQFSSRLQSWAGKVKLEAFTSTPRKPKKKKPKPPYDPAHPHVSTARLFAQKKKSRASPD